MVVGRDDFSRNLAKELEAEYVNVKLHIFPDNEIKPTLEIKTNDEIRGKDVLVVSRTDRFEPKPNDAIIELGLTVKNLSFLDADKIDILMPYMFYARQDESFQKGEPESFSIITGLYENWLGRFQKVRSLITMNSHLYGKEEDINDFFTKKIKPHDINSSGLFADYFKSKKLKNAVIISPGAREIAKELSEQLKIPYESLDKPRNHKTGEIKLEHPKINFKNRDVVIHDDLASSGGTIEETVDLVYETQPRNVYVALPHLLTEKGIERVCNLGVDVVTTDSLDSGKRYKRFTELSTVPLFSNYIRKL